MSYPALLFLYSPFPYWAVFTLLAYRNDLSRFVHPFRDSHSLRAWWSVCRYLGLIGQVDVPRPSSRRDHIPVLTAPIAAAAVSLSWGSGFFPPVWYNLLVAQATSGLILSVATARYLGPLPSRPHADALRYPRLGSRIKHLPKLPDSGSHQDDWASEEDPMGTSPFQSGLQKRDENLGEK
jgi:hypothetical protein